MWKCTCDCGQETTVWQYHLRRGKQKSCGCMRLAMSGSAQFIHGWSHHRISSVWRAMINRCHNPKNRGFYLYGGRGVAVCQRWRESLIAFIEDMGLPPTDKHTLDRIDNDGDYEPGNCRWATMATQNRNRRNNVMITYKGKTQCLTDWAHELGVSVDLIIARRRRGWSDERALREPSHRK